MSLTRLVSYSSTHSNLRVHAFTYRSIMNQRWITQTRNQHYWYLCHVSFLGLMDRNELLVRVETPEGCSGSGHHPEYLSIYVDTHSVMMIWHRTRPLWESYIDQSSQTLCALLKTSRSWYHHHPIRPGGLMESLHNESKEAWWDDWPDG